MEETSEAGAERAAGQLQVGLGSWVRATARRAQKAGFRSYVFMLQECQTHWRVQERREHDRTSVPVRISVPAAESGLKGAGEDED